MSNYVDIIRIAFATFPLIAFAITLPFILWQYHKYGAISLAKVVVIYSFVLYLTCAYFLVILPLPDQDTVATLTTPTTQLIPFSFVGDFFRETSLRLDDVTTYLPALTESCVLVPLYNLFLTIPFGIYLRYYFRCDLKKVLILSFLLSLFFELTQLSGLYFIYPRGYRLFDVDDLLLNTLGGLIGYFIAWPFMKFLPSRQQIDRHTSQRGQTVSGPRRFLAFILDLWILGFISFLFAEIWPSLPNRNLIIFGLIGFIYYFVLPALTGGRTLGMWFLKLRIVDVNDQPNLRGYYLRTLLILIIYFIAPLLISEILHYLPANSMRIFLYGVYGLSLGGFYLFSSIRCFFTTRPLLHDRLSNTRLISTILSSE